MKKKNIKTYEYIFASLKKFGEDYGSYDIAWHDYKVGTIIVTKSHRTKNFRVIIIRKEQLKCQILEKIIREMQ